MKKKTVVLLSTTLFCAGLFIGVAGTYFYSIKYREEEPLITSSLSKISSDSAYTLFHQYYDTAHIYSSPFKGFALERDQVTLLYRFLSTNSNLKGIRIYMGPDKPKKIRIIAGINSSDLDDNSYMYRTEVKYSDPCPPICDRQSPITAPKPAPSR